MSAEAEARKVTVQVPRFVTDPEGLRELVYDPAVGNDLRQFVLTVADAWEAQR